LFLDSDSATIHFGEDGEVKLIHVADNGLQLTGSGLNSNFTLAAYHTTDGTVPDLDLKKSGSSTIGTNAATANGEALGQIRFSGVDTSGSVRTAVKMSVAQVGTDANAVNGDFTLDVEGDINLDTNGSDILLKKGGTTFGSFRENSSNFRIKSEVSNKDITFLGNDGGNEITALTLDMADAGSARFANGTAALPAVSFISDANTGMFRIGSDTLGFSTVGAQRLAIDSTGIKFHGDTATANALNDYEEANWSPKIFVGTTEQNLSRADGTYVKVGDFVHCAMGIIVNGNISGSGAVTIKNFPFTAFPGGASGNARAAGSIAYTDATFMPAGILMGSNTNIASMHKNSTAGTTGSAMSSTMQGSDLPANWNMHFSVSFRTTGN